MNKRFVNCEVCNGTGFVESDVPNMQCDECGGDGRFCAVCRIPSLFCECDEDDSPTAAQQEDGA